MLIQWRVFARAMDAAFRVSAIAALAAFDCVDVLFSIEFAVA